MIKQFIDKLLGGHSRKPRFGKRQEVGPEVHGIDPTLVDERALSVVHTLKEAGHEAYIVGGAVRDLLLGLRPKDFDVATNATPEQVKSLFRRAFIIGRRFRIVHVVFGRGREHEVIEVSTFRAYLDAAAAEAVSGNERTSKSELAGMKHAVDASGRVLRDNVWGPQEEDAARRDFTINAMYYDPERRIVVDYHNGIADAKKRLIRMIGDPAARYREDPVRLIRAVRFTAKLAGLGFKLEPKTRAPLQAALALLAEVPQSRLFDEMLKLLQTGHSIASIEQIKALGMKGIYPLLDLVVERSAEPFVRAALQDTDRRVGEDKPVAPSFLLACVLWADVRDGWKARLDRRMHPFPALQEAIDEVFESRIGDISGRGKLGADMREIWMMQPRFEKRTGHTPFSMVEQPRFRAAFDFMRLRADIGEVDVVLADWWQEFSQASDTVREDLMAALRDEQQKQQRGKARRVPREGEEREPRPPREPAGTQPRQAREAQARDPRDIGGAPPPQAGRLRRRSGRVVRRDRRRHRRLKAVRAPVTAYVGLGANLGEPVLALREALAALRRLPGVQALRASGFWRSAPVDAGGPDFVNAVAELQTTLTAPELLAQLQALENAAGRERPFRNAPRTLDLDLLLYGSGRIASAALAVPHPRLRERAFVLRPLAELAPALVSAADLAAVAGQRIAPLPPASSPG